MNVISKNIKSKINRGDTIFTHNPWGEYGHPDHILIFKVIYDLRNKYNLKIYTSGYVSSRSWNLMLSNQNIISEKAVCFNTNKKFNTFIKNIYIKCKCWTWPNDYIWPKSEIFFKINNNQKTLKKNNNNFSTIPLNFLQFPSMNSKIKIFIKKYIPYKFLLLLKYFKNNFFNV